MTKDSKQSVRAVLLAAGQGKRMKSANPKVLHEVLGLSILKRVINALDQINLEYIHVVIGHGAFQVEQFLKANPPKTPYKIHIQEPQLGTGHALKQVTHTLTDFTGTLLVSVADTPLLTADSLKKLVDEHNAQKATVSLLTTTVDDPKNYGRIVRDDQNKVVGIVEDKDASPKQKQIHEINPAIYCFKWPDIKSGLDDLKNDNRQQEYYLTDLIAWTFKDGKNIASIQTTDWQEVAGINSRLELIEATKLLNDRTIAKLGLESGVTVVDPSSTWIAPEVEIGSDTTILPGCYLVGEIVIGNNCVIGPHTVITGPTKIGDNTSVVQSHITNSQIGSSCHVGPFAHMRGSASISNNVRIGNFVELKNSAIASDTNVSHLSYVGDAEVGSGTNLGAGTITANYNHVTKKKSPTKIGNNTSTGSNSVLVAPVVIGNDVIVAAGTVVTKDVPDGALAVGRARQENKANWVQGKKKKIETKK